MKLDVEAAVVDDEQIALMPTEVRANYYMPTKRFSVHLHLVLEEPDTVLWHQYGSPPFATMFSADELFDLTHDGIDRSFENVRLALAWIKNAQAQVADTRHYWSEVKSFAN